MEYKEAREIIMAGVAWANWNEEQKQAMKTAVKVINEKIEMDTLEIAAANPLYSRRKLEENIEMAIHETELLHKTINPSKNSNIDRRFKNIVEILKG